MVIKRKKSCFELNKIKYIIGLCLVLFFYLDSYAQFYNGSQLYFGKGRVQTEQKVWSYYRTPVADIYFYPQGKHLAQYAAKEIQTIIPKLEKTLRYTLTNKIQLIIYTRHSDYMQSNVGLEVENFYNTGGVTPIYGHKVFLYFDGNMRVFHENLESGLASLMLNRIIRGQSVLSGLSSSDLAAIPYWFTDGLSAYFSKEWTTEIDNQVREGILSGKYKKIHNLPIKEQAIAGYSLWHYIANTYGEDMVINFLYYIRAVRNYEKTTRIILGISFKQLAEDWMKYYTKRYLTHPEDDLLAHSVLKKYKKNTVYLYPKQSPNEEYIAYISNQEGKVGVHLQHTETKKSKRIYRYHYRIEDNPDYSFPIISWHPNSKLLYMMIEDESKVYIQPYNIESKKWEKRQVVFVHKITDFSFSSDGRYIVMSAIKDGQSDIYVYTMASRSLVAITDDKADDYSPQFISNNKYIIFSSNRENDTISNNYEQEYRVKTKYDLFAYDVETKSKVLHRLTHTPNAEEKYAFDLGNDYLTFISDRNGIYNRYIGKFDKEITHIDTAIHYSRVFRDFPITDRVNSILYQHVNTNNLISTDLSLHKDKFLITKEQLPSVEFFSKKPLMSTISLLHKLAKQQVVDSLKSIPLDSTITRKRLQFVKLIEVNDSIYAKHKKYDIYADTANNLSRKSMLIPRVYHTQFSLNSVVLQADFSYLNATYQQFVPSSNPIYLNPGLNLFMMVEAKDLLEDYRLVGGVRFSVDLNKEFVFSYEDYSKRLEKQISVYFQSINNVNHHGYYQSQQSTSLFYILKYPFDRVNSINFTNMVRYNKYALKATDDISLHQKDVNSFWIGTKAEYVIDYTYPMTINLMKGMRGKVFVEFMCTPDKSFQNIYVVGLDLRHYTKIHRTLVWANRFATSTSYGKNRLIYYMGGLDNWWFATFNSDIYVDTTINYTYQTLATNMRGFDQNIRNGTSFFVLNSELRFAVVQCIMDRPMKNDFLNSLQLVVFGDIGTAWTGLTPYSEGNSLYKQIITSGPSIKITLNKQTEPIVAGFGTGIRFLLLGYFIRLDYAWGIENYKINKGKFYISLNLDF
ncbi:MAG: hypothetical protein GX330_08440 [Bacteroidales bacterium]|nr:hypothetical protein [Bacteroidales bacterium]